MIALLAILGAGFGAGILLIANAVRSSDSESTSKTSVLDHLPHDVSERAIRAAIGAALLGIPTRWPIAFVGGALLGWWFKDLFGGEATRRHNIARTEAIASWTEMLRDTIASAHGLEETLSASASVAPDAIKPEVIQLATRLEHQELKSCLRQFATELAHPTGDLVVAALFLAADGSPKDLGELLGTLAVATRDEAGMYLRIDAARARMRTAVKVIALSTVATAVGLALMNRPYLAAYGDLTGQAVLALIVVTWLASLSWLNSMSRFDQPERFFAKAQHS